MNGPTSKSGLIREGEIYRANDDLFLKPYMIAANCFVDVIHHASIVALTKHEFNCMKNGIFTIKEHYQLLKLIEVDDHDVVGGMPSHLYASNVLELSNSCFMFATQHNNDVMICLKKGVDICILPEAIFYIEFDTVQFMLDSLAKNYASNWCFYCDQHKTLKSCVVCADETF
jgi:hypothetical protein